MYSRTSTSGSTGSFSEQTERLREALESADAVVAGAGAGLSTSAGFEYGGERFRKYFPDFEARYGFHDMYTGGFFPFPSPEEYWAFWARNILVNRYMDPPKPVYDILYELLGGRNCFVITTNVDHCFQKAGFDKDRLFYTQGDYGLFQCSRPCCRLTWDNEAAVREMVSRTEDLRIPSELIPVCPRCGRPLTLNLRSDDRFVEDAGWHAASERYSAFLKRYSGGRVLFLELGVGWNTPGIIKYPFWQMTMRNPDAVYVSVNAGEAVCPGQIEKQSICINGDILEVLMQLRGTVGTSEQIS